MKKLVLAVSIFTAVVSVSAAQAASTGTITFNGLLTANTCDVSVAGETADATVVLPTISVSQLTTATNTAGRTGFDMALTNCAGTLETASAFFESGTSVDITTGRLRNMSGSAENVELQLRDGSSATQAVIQAGNTNQIANTSYVDVSTGSATLPYAVEYYATDETKAGTVVSNVVYSIQYK